MKINCFSKSENEEVNKNKRKDLSMDELDGVFVSQKEVFLNLKTLPFIEDYKFEISQGTINKFYDFFWLWTN